MSDISPLLDSPLAIVAEVLDAIHYLNDFTPMTYTLITAVTEAIDLWVCDIATEHHYSQRFTQAPTTEPFAAALSELLGAVKYLQNAGNTTITVAEAFEDALTYWLIDTIQLAAQ